jgi:hypothetical protein
MYRYMSPLLVALLLPASVFSQERIPVLELGTRFTLTGQLQHPLNECITVQGVVVEGPYKGFEGGLNIRPQRVQGRALQDDIQICIKPFYKWGEKAFGSGVELPTLEAGKTYEVKGYETGGYVGTPARAMELAGVSVQTTRPFFRSEFVVVSARSMEPIHFGPADFVGRRALIAGIAQSMSGKSMLLGSDWQILVDGKSPWPTQFEGKQVESLGEYRLTDEKGRYELVDGTCQLVNLDDQIGRDVELRGIAISNSEGWWFRRRGVNIHVDRMDELPGWTPNNHWQPVIIRGTLEKAMLRNLDKNDSDWFSATPKPDRVESYVVRNASWQALKELLSPERPLDESK